MITWITSTLGFCSLQDQFPEDASIVQALHLEDGWNEPETIYFKAKEILARLARGKKVMVFCYAGLSRSPSLVILVLSWLNKISWDDEFVLVKKQAPQIQVALDLRDACLEALVLMNERLAKQCPSCSCPIESSEEKCNECYNKKLS